MLQATTIGRRLVLGFLALFLVSAVAVSIAIMAARTVNAALESVAASTERGRRVARVGGLLREFYMHQAHLALGMHHAEHLDQVRLARTGLDEAVSDLEALPLITASKPSPQELRSHLSTLDELLDKEFLPALEAGRHADATLVHQKVAALVQVLARQLDAQHLSITAEIATAQARMAEHTRQATALSTVVLVAALALAIAIAVWMTRKISLPVARLEDAARRLGDAPEGSRVPESGPTEVVALGATLNQMLTALEDQRRARSEAEKLAAVGRVAAGIAHEINNPLSVVLGTARMLERQGGDVAAEARTISDEARLCQAIVNDLLDYARPEARRREPVAMDEIVTAAAERVDAAVDTRLPPEPLMVCGDRVRLEQLTSNLIRNALVFGEKVQVELRRQSSHSGMSGVRLTVSDDGPGIAAEDIDRVFEPFYTTRNEGTGLGLAIARSIAATHGGTLEARPGPGGHLELWLPSFGEA